ncbi:MAG: choice-of-anchor Q domain-containing protein, partial [Bacteroidota bacterium]
RNSASDGSAVNNYGAFGVVSSPSNVNPRFTNCTFSRNSGATMYNNANANQYGSVSPVIENCIFSNSSFFAVDWVNNGTAAQPHIAYSLVSASSQNAVTQTGTSVGLGMIYNQNPRFVNSSTDLSLREDSPVIDAGNSASVTVATDILGRPRIQDGGVDMGAYEFTQSEFYVKANGGNDTNTGGDFSSAYATLQKALEDAEVFGTGAKIYVATGTYEPTQQYDFTTGATSTAGTRFASFKIPDGIEIYGGFSNSLTGTVDQSLIDARDFSANPTILSGDFNSDDNVSGSGSSLSITGNTENAYHVIFTENVSATTVLDGFSITGGNGNSGNPNNRGGGIYNKGSGAGNISNPTIRNCILFGNNGDFGGAMSNDSRNSGTTNPTLINCTFAQNTASNGAAIHSTAGSGGTANPSYTDCVIEGNVSTGNGGSIFNFASGGTSSPSFLNSQFINNISGGSGGAMYNFAPNGVSSPLFTNVVFTKNEAVNNGGALFNDGNNNGISSPLILNCTFWGNDATVSGGGMNNRGTSGGTSIPLIQNSIFWNNTGGSWTNDSAAPSVTHTLVAEASLPSGSTDGGNNIFGQDPLFTNAASGTLTLTTSSPAIDAGNSAIVTIATDATGNARIQGCAVDMGAFENSIELPEIDFTPTATNFGTVTINTSNEISYTITNSGTGTLTISSITSSNTPTFTVQNDFVATSLALLGLIDFLDFYRIRHTTPIKYI